MGVGVILGSVRFYKFISINFKVIEFNIVK